MQDSERPLTMHLSQVDEDRFGVRTARAFIRTEESLPALLEYCHQQQVKFLIVRCPTTALHTAQGLESVGCRLMDTLIYYKRNLLKQAIPDLPSAPHIRSIHPEDVAAVQQVAEQSFKGYFGHYHADPRLDPAKCDQGYVSWAVRSSVSREVADDVLVAEAQGDILGFATLRLNSPAQGEGVLFGVAPKAQGQGIYRSLMIHAMDWFLRHAAEEMIVSTQITNIAVQKVWTRVAFEPGFSHYTFHKWFDE